MDPHQAALTGHRPFTQRILPAIGSLLLFGLAAWGIVQFLHGSGRGVAEAAIAPEREPHKMVLFSGQEAELKQNWLKRGSDEPAAWKIENGAMVSGGGDIVTKEKFTDFQLHVEFRVPYMPNEHGQARGNSGVGLQARYEIQILDSYGIADPGSGDCGAVYSQAAPLFNACKPPREWQTYDITFRAPRFDAGGNKTANARVMVFQNGIPVQNNQEITGPTGLQIDEDFDKPGPVLLQDHGDKMEFRNVWVIPLPLQGASHY